MATIGGRILCPAKLRWRAPGSELGSHGRCACGRRLRWRRESRLCRVAARIRDPLYPAKHGWQLYRASVGIAWRRAGGIEVHPRAVMPVNKGWLSTLRRRLINGFDAPDEIGRASCRERV